MGKTCQGTARAEQFAQTIDQLRGKVGSIFIARQLRTVLVVDAGVQFGSRQAGFRSAGASPAFVDGAGEAPAPHNRASPVDQHSPRHNLESRMDAQKTWAAQA